MCFVYLGSVVLKLLNSMDDITVCLTICLYVIDICDSRSEMPHTRDYLGVLCITIKQIYDKVSNTAKVFLKINSPDGL